MALGDDARCSSGEAELEPLVVRRRPSRRPVPLLRRVRAAAAIWRGVMPFFSRRSSTGFHRRGPPGPTHSAAARG